ncbi:hypothetical protein R1sor_000011 [Riccia sorocarpa]|uniref:Uncharacterized protein n=1 Tax=Riccia sorocarpa TaxID=122646 RepID=A0ABD3GUD6_9MARC
MAVGDLTSRASSADARIQALHAQILQKDHRMEDLMLVVNGLRKDLAAERADRAELIAELDDVRDTRLVTAGRDEEIVVDNYVHDNASPAHPRPFVYTSSVTVRWRLTAEQMGSVTPDELNPETQRATWELLQRYIRFQGFVPPLTSWSQRSVDLKIVVMRGNKAMWPPGKREEWNRVNEENDLQAIRHFFLGWPPLKEADGGTIGLSGIWHRAVCHVYQFMAEKLINGAAARNNSAFYDYQLLHEQCQPLFKRLALLDKLRERAERDIVDWRLQPEDLGPEYHLRHRAIEFLYFYLCPSRASPGTFAEYAAKLYPIVLRNWPPECFNFSGKFLPGLRQLEGGTASPSQALQRANSQPAHVVLSDDEDNHLE